jgi:hypothetical protein
MCRPDRSVPIIDYCAANGFVGMNSVTVAIEHAGFSGEPLTDIQIAASARLHAWLADVLDFGPLTRDRVIGHYQIDACNREFCPGETFPWERVMADIDRPALRAVLDDLWALTIRLAALEHQPLAVEAQRQIVRLKIILGEQSPGT